MKVSIADFELKLMPFMKKIVESMPSSLHKFLGGAMIATSATKLEEFIRSQADESGMVDINKMRQLVNSGFEASGGTVIIPFGSEALTRFGVSPVNVKISRNDADMFFAEFGV